MWGLGFDPQGSKIEKKIFWLLFFPFAWENLPTFLAEHIYKQYFPLVLLVWESLYFRFILKDNLSGDRILSWSYWFFFFFVLLFLWFNILKYFLHRLSFTISDGNSACNSYLRSFRGEVFSSSLHSFLFILVFCSLSGICPQVQLFGILSLLDL